MATRKSLLWQIYPTYLLLIILSLLAFSWITFSTIKTFYYEETAKELEEKSWLAIGLFAEDFSTKAYDKIDALSKVVGNGFRITVILPNGVVIGDSEKPPQTMDNHADRPEIKSAMSGEKGMAIRYSYTLETDMMYVALPVKKNREIVGVLRTSTPMTHVSKVLWSTYKSIAIGAFFTAILAALICLWIARRISLPIQDLKKGANLLAKGNFSYRTPINGSVEIATLAFAMNQMAEQLEGRINTITRQSTELEAIFTGMIEAVIVLDNERKVTRVNKAASMLFNIDIHTSKGRVVEEICRNSELQKFVESAVSSETPITMEIVFHTNEDRYLEAYGASLQNEGGERKGSLLVFHDITRLTRLERVRRDFVANVSHELKTPITSIKGFVETLLDESKNNPEKTDHFLQIIQTHTDRLDAIINDLLSLSRIEQSNERQQIQFSEINVRDVVDAATMLSSNSAKQRNISIAIECPEYLSIRANHLLLEQALINLIENAIKYSQPDGQISIAAKKDDDTIVISVMDNGCGIPKEDLPRIFERFYRVDKARSRKLGGTGLGLAIVKHVAQAHNGDVSAESVFGKGSTFKITLPMM